jgi:invasion protein IalB
MNLVSIVRSGSALAGAALMVATMPAVAQTQTSTQSAAINKNNDPNRIICEKQQEVGSRLNSRKICMTAQQWEEQRRRDRESLQDAQQRSLEPNSG